MNEDPLLGHHASGAGAAAAGVPAPALSRAERAQRGDPMLTGRQRALRAAFYVWVNVQVRVRQSEGGMGWKRGGGLTPGGAPRLWGSAAGGTMDAADAWEVEGHSSGTAGLVDQ